MLPMSNITTREDKTRMKKPVSLKKLDLSIVTIEEEEVERVKEMNKVITPTTTVVTKNAPPRTLLIPTSPAPEPAKDTRLENTSGAPFPKDSKVTPAMEGESLKTLDSFSKEEQKYWEAVLPRR